MRVFLHISLLLLLIGLPRLRADVLEAVQPGNDQSESLRGGHGPPSIQLIFPRSRTVAEWLSQADQNLSQSVRVTAPAGPHWEPGGGRAGMFPVASAGDADALNQPWLLLIPRSVYAPAVANPVYRPGDRDVSFGLQHPGFQSPLRQIYLDRCRLALRESLEFSNSAAPVALDSSPSPVRVPGILDTLVSAMQRSQSGDRILGFADPALATESQRLCAPELSLASQPFQFKVAQLPGRPFRPLGTLQSQWQRLQLAFAGLQLLTQTRITGHQAGFSSGNLWPARSARAVLPALSAGLVLCVFFARRFRRPVH